MVAEHRQPQAEELVAALEHDLEQTAGVRAAVVGEVQLQDMLAEGGRDVQPLAMGQAVGVQGDEDPRADPPHPHGRPEPEDPHPVV